MYERHAYWCTHKSHENDAVPLRVFIHAGDPVPSCPIRGHGKMKRQNNHPYFGKPVEDAVCDKRGCDKPREPGSCLCAEHHAAAVEEARAQ